MNLNIFSKSASNPGFVNSISEIISEIKQYNISYEKLETYSKEVDNETLKLKLKDISKIYKAFEDKITWKLCRLSRYVKFISRKNKIMWLILKMLIYT